MCNALASVLKYFLIMLCLTTRGDSLKPLYNLSADGISKHTWFIRWIAIG